MTAGAPLAADFGRRLARCDAVAEPARHAGLRAEIDRAVASARASRTPRAPWLADLLLLRAIAYERSPSARHRTQAIRSLEEAFALLDAQGTAPPPAELARLGRLLASRDPDRARASFRAAIVALERQCGEHAVALVGPLQNLATLSAVAGEPAGLTEGVAALGRAVDILARCYGTASPRLAESLWALAALLERAGESDAAEQVRGRAEAVTVTRAN